MNSLYEKQNDLETFSQKSSDQTSYGTGSFPCSEQKSILGTDPSVSTNNPHNNTKYFRYLPSEIDIFKNAISLNDIRNNNVRKQVEWFSNRFQTILIYFKDELPPDISISFPSLLISQSEDDESVLIEWLSKDFRIGFAFEVDENTSSWYFIFNDKKRLVNNSDLINKDNIDEKIIESLRFVFNHT